MILLLDTSTEICYLTLINKSERFDYEWQAGRSLADGILKFIREKLNEHNCGWQDISGIGVCEGPGSFTGLRIGLTVMNTIASDRKIPIVGSSGEKWRNQTLERLNNEEDDKLVMPKYGQEPNITKPRK